jgi:hypothetical protein
VFHAHKAFLYLVDDDLKMFAYVHFETTDSLIVLSVIHFTVILSDLLWKILATQLDQHFSLTQNVATSGLLFKRFYWSFHGFLIL